VTKVLACVRVLYRELQFYNSSACHLRVNPLRELTEVKF